MNKLIWRHSPFLAPGHSKDRGGLSLAETEKTCQFGGTHLLQAIFRSKMVLCPKRLWVRFLRIIGNFLRYDRLRLGLDLRHRFCLRLLLHFNLRGSLNRLDAALHRGFTQVKLKIHPGDSKLRGKSLDIHPRRKKSLLRCILSHLHNILKTHPFASLGMKTGIVQKSQGRFPHQTAVRQLNIIPEGQSRQRKNSL